MSKLSSIFGLTILVLASYANAQIDVYNPIHVMSGGLMGVASSPSVTPDVQKCIDKLETYKPGISSKEIHFDIETVNSESASIKPYAEKDISLESEKLSLQNFLCTQRSFDSWNTIKRDHCRLGVSIITLKPMKSAFSIAIKEVACSLTRDNPESIIFESNLEYSGWWPKTLGTNRFYLSQLIRNPLLVPLNHDRSFVVKVEIR